MVKELQGSPYVWAEEGPNQFDCSGYIYYMYGSMRIEIPRIAREQAKKVLIIKNKTL
jgi:cell wall-associated NlpC family hydrolase